ncbi:MAG TPA: hypothetical protein VD969_04200 [Symbiobacteriaceae bacterium]|nr:hypothetical protein [Symbiobacteriaceae bacterium]
MNRHDISSIANVVEALEQEIVALTRLDPYDPQIYRLHERLHVALQNMYTEMPRGV